MEFALLLPVFMMLVLGMFSGGLAYNKQIALRSAARDGARFGAVLPTTPATVAGKTWAQRVQDVVVSQSEGELTASNVCVALVGGSTDPAFQAGPPDSGAATGSCYTDSISGSDRRVQVSVRGPAKIEALVFTMEITLRARSTARYEDPT